MILPPEYVKRTLAFARRTLDDIPEVAASEMKIRDIGGVPVLFLGFVIPDTTGLFPACAVRLVTVSRSNPLAAGTLLTEGDRLRRHLRDSVETYLAKHGIRIPIFQEG